MTQANPIFTLGESSSIVSPDGRTPALADLYKLPLDNKNAPNGVVVADENGKVYGRWFVSADTAEAVNATVPALGEIVFKNDIAQLTVGNGLVLGGVPVNFSSQSCLMVAADGTQAKNGQSLADVIARAGQRTPYGQPLSASNRATVLIAPGVYDLTGLAATITVPNFVNLIGVGGSECVTLICSTSRRLQCLYSAGVDLYSVLRGITFQSVTPGASLVLNLAGLTAPNFCDVQHADLNFPGLTAAQSCMTIVGGSGSDTPTIRGSASFCRTTGMGLYGGHTQTPTAGSWTYAIEFYKCTGGDRSFGGSNTTIGVRDGLLTGKLVECTHNGTGANAWSVRVNCGTFGCSVPAIQRVGANAEINNTNVREAVGGFSISNGGTAQQIKIFSNRLAATFGGGVTNYWSTKLDDGGNAIG